MSGVSGDMLLGALVDLGTDLGTLQAGIDSLGLPKVKLVASDTNKKGFRATKVDVQYEPEHVHRHFHQIVEMIEGSDLSTPQRALAKRIFTRLAEAESRVHGTSIEKVHFHEVGAADSIADIVGVAIGLDLLGVDQILCSPVPTGHGFVRIAHGRTSIPAPATAELLKGCPLAESSVNAELTTPTGAAIVCSVAHGFGPLPAIKIEAIGYGAGTRDLDEQANILRLIVGETDDSTEADSVWVLETNLDDVTGEVLGHATSQLMAAGALDVYTTAIQMKKNRPGVMLSVICDRDAMDTLEAIIFRETTSLGIRRWSARRHKLARRACTVDTQWGPVQGKVAVLPDGEERFSPEYEACRQISLDYHVPLQEVYEQARRSFQPEH